MIMRKRLWIPICCLLLFTGCQQTELKIQEGEQKIVVKDSVVPDENGNTGLYIKQDVEDINPTAYYADETEPETVEETTTEPPTESQTNLPEGFQAVDETITISADVNIRDQATSEGSTILGSVPAGTSVHRTAVGSDWSLIEYNDIVGYIYNEYIA